MGKIEVTSDGQSGGITANNVSIYGENSPKKKKNRWLILGEIIAVIAAIVSILAYFEIFPFEKSKKEKTTNQVNEIKSNLNSPINSNVENQTINYIQVDTAIPKKQKIIITNSMQSNMKKNNEDKITVTSHNQTGGITANQVNIINNPQRVLNNDTELALVEAIDLRFAKNNFDKNTRISITAPPDAEARTYGNQLIVFLKSKGYNVWPNLSTYMGNMGLGNLDIGLKADTVKKQFEIAINYNKNRQSEK